MIIETNANKPKFKPFTINITFETPEELAEFYIRLNPNNKEHYSKNIQKTYNFDLFNVNKECYDDLFDVVEEYLIQMGCRSLIYSPRIND